ncbi:MAG: serine hydrolase, partial [Roseiflexaceae bacterium]
PWGGLCTNAAGALALVDAFMPHTSFLHHSLAYEATSVQTDTLGGGFMAPLMWPQSPWGLGPELRGTKTPHWVASCFAADSFGHSGSSGMVVWADPHQRFRFVMLGARAADSGWLLRHGPKLSALLWQEVIQ